MRSLSEESTSFLSSSDLTLELLLVALAQAAPRSFWVDVERHGRTADFGHTVGWFTELRAVHMEISSPGLRLHQLGMISSEVFGAVAARG